MSTDFDGADDQAVDTGKRTYEQKSKNPKRRNAKRRANYALDKMQEIENELAALEGRKPKDVVGEYMQRKAKEDNTIDVEVISEDCQDFSDQSQGESVDDCAISLPALLPKTIGPQQDSNQIDDPSASSNNGAAQQESDGQEPTEYVNPYPYLSADWWEHCAPEEKLSRCRAISTDGTRCRQKSITGGRVCRHHGGLAPHVKLAARNRIENAADQMAEQLLRMAIDPKTKDSVKLAAIRDALDRAGLKAPEQVVVSAGQSSAFEDIAQDVGYSGIQHTQPEYIDSQRESMKVQHDSDPFGPTESNPFGSSRSSGQSNQAEYQQDSNIWNEGTAFNDPGSSRKSHTAPVDGFGAGQHVGTDRDCDGLAARRRASREHWDMQYRRTEHVTGEDAIEAANAANREAGALKALPPGRKRR
ncbi:hypothetical protein H5U98_06810 [Mycolicibacterium boenickei]|uniref:Uncharacterized protein n=1 Tax=Mycolicibacterium boenickei TaxID=146017 RepID=A0AAX3A0F1_9MYCO|nr:hypothetical protein [Mycolicibacterium boenickei]UNC01098.1 hypothetical protein H5U98_06810 [Mycolicibacterium boenickei]BBX90943.1 hypothetical protein MBOE_25920 [Mycolicibacterium boenickei]